MELRTGTFRWRVRLFVGGSGRIFGIPVVGVGNRGGRICPCLERYFCEKEKRYNLVRDYVKVKGHFGSCLIN